MIDMNYQLNLLIELIHRTNLQLDDMDFGSDYVRFIIDISIFVMNDELVHYHIDNCNIYLNCSLLDSTLR